MHTLRHIVRRPVAVVLAALALAIVAGAGARPATSQAASIVPRPTTGTTVFTSQALRPDLTFVASGPGWAAIKNIGWTDSPEFWITVYAMNGAVSHHWVPRLREGSIRTFYDSAITDDSTPCVKAVADSTRAIAELNESNNELRGFCLR
jgi:hypothetical protein